MAVAGVSYNSASGGTVGKGAVQDALHVNDAIIQRGPVNFTVKPEGPSMSSIWQCTSGDQWTGAWVIDSFVKVDSTLYFNPNDKILGWTRDDSEYELHRPCIKRAGLARRQPSEELLGDVAGRIAEAYPGLYGHQRSGIPALAASRDPCR